MSRAPLCTGQLLSFRSKLKSSGRRRGKWRRSAPLCREACSAPALGLQPLPQHGQGHDLDLVGRTIAGVGDWCEAGMGDRRGAGVGDWRGTGIGPWRVQARGAGVLGIDASILDLRGCLGGTVGEIIRFLDLFFDESPPGGPSDWRGSGRWAPTLAIDSSCS
jgi:hypothetical protein